MRTSWVSQVMGTHEGVVKELIAVAQAPGTGTAEDEERKSAARLAIAHIQEIWEEYPAIVAARDAEAAKAREEGKPEPPPVAPLQNGVFVELRGKTEGDPGRACEIVVKVVPMQVFV